MATKVIMPALGMAQETGRVLAWLKREGDAVEKGEILMEIETDKATVEVEAAASGTLAAVTVAEGAEAPVGEVIALILAPGEQLPSATTAPDQKSGTEGAAGAGNGARQSGQPGRAAVTPVAARLAAANQLELDEIQSRGERIAKADVLAHLDNRGTVVPETAPALVPASPKARRLARERGIELSSLSGTGPGGAVLAANVPESAANSRVPTEHSTRASSSLSHIWRVMAERTTHSWTSVPHFFLSREVNASRLIQWRERVTARATEKITYTDLLVRLVASALQQHPHLNGTWRDNAIAFNERVNVGLAVAMNDGLVVPVIHDADSLTLSEIASRRKEVVARAQSSKLRPDDIQGGTFTISNLGMYGVDAFNAIINEPQAAILAVGRIAERVVPLNGSPAIQPMMVLTLSCDHRVVDGARGAQFLDSLVELIEEPLSLLT